MSSMPPHGARRAPSGRVSIEELSEEFDAQTLSRWRSMARSLDLDLERERWPLGRRLRYALWSGALLAALGALLGIINALLVGAAPRPTQIPLLTMTIGGLIAGGLLGALRSELIARLLRELALHLADLRGEEA